MATDQKARAELARGRLKGEATRRKPTKEATADPHVASEPTDLLAVLGSLSDAISVVTVVHHSLAGQEIAGVGDEEVTLRYALTLLQSAYSALDATSCRLR